MMLLVKRVSILSSRILPFASSRTVMTNTHPQDAAYAAALESPEAFWSHEAKQLSWTTPPKTTIQRSTKTLKSGIKHQHWRWFPEGDISTSYNCVDRHVDAGNGQRTAIIWDSPVTGTQQKISYAELADEVAALAGVLREEGVKKGDVVLIYMPMIPAALIGMLATVRLGAVHAVVFGGFSAPSLAQRIDASKPSVVLTASCGIEGAKGPLPYQPLVRGAIEQSKHKPARTIVWQREERRWDPVVKEDGERNWQRLVKSARNRGIKAENVPVKSNDALYIIYTSGTTGAPKGVLREAGGHAVGLNYSMRYLFGIKPGDVVFCASDIGWVVGHSFILYAPLLAGATTVLFEGKPIGTPDAGTFWRVVEQHKVNVMFTAPTALRAIRREDGQHTFFTERGERGGLKALRALFLAGERSEPAVIKEYTNLLQKYCAPGASTVDNWWSSESGSPMTGLAQNPNSWYNGSGDGSVQPLKTKPGSAGKPMPGWDIRVVDDDGNQVAQGKTGNIVLNMPLAPTGLTTLWQDEKRFYNGYMKRFEGKWLDTGDAGLIDSEGYVHIHGRSDDMINVAAHRLSTATLEQAISSHASIIDNCVIPAPDALKGHVPFAFVALSPSSAPVAENELLAAINVRVRAAVGPIATLGGVIIAQGVIPRTRSGKTLRRVLKQMVEDASEGNFDKEVEVPATIEDVEVVERARKAIKKYFTNTRKSKL